MRAPTRASWTKRSRARSSLTSCGSISLRARRAPVLICSTT
jgi:hypothetical protein